MPTNSAPILIIGGAGFIGSHMLLTLQQNGLVPIVLDNLSTGQAHAVYKAELIIGNAGDRSLLRQIFKSHDFVAVMHFASLIDVRESFLCPEKYYQNNVVETIALLDVLSEHKIKHFIFSSSAAVYGEPRYVPIDEKHPLNPLSPYGRTKRIAEEVIRDYADKHRFTYAILRYFNAAGADPEGRLGERHRPETHLIPLLLQTAVGEQNEVAIFGKDYATPDGTCIRDYIHIKDICDAHMLALQHLLEGGQSKTYNLGTGSGCSVNAVIETVEKITGQTIKRRYCERRLGDPAILVADASLIYDQLKWRPQVSNIELIIEHAWQYLLNSTLL